MNIEELRTYCLSKKAVTEDFPFGETTLVFRILGKLFALTSLDTEEPSVNLKCEPELAILLRDKYEAVIPGYHMNKKHWNTVYLESDLKDSKLKELIDHSYDLVIGKLTKREREQYNRL